MNRAPDRLCWAVVVVLCVRVTCTLAENDVAGAPLQESGEVASRTGPGTAPCGPLSSPCKARHDTGNRHVVQRGEALRLPLPHRRTTPLLPLPQHPRLL